MVGTPKGETIHSGSEYSATFESSFSNYQLPIKPGRLDGKLHHAQVFPSPTHVHARKWEHNFTVGTSMIIYASAGRVASAAPPA
eukprot:4655339-Amphidinium_carterae.1